jgi:hypothetical protein
MPSDYLQQRFSIKKNKTLSKNYESDKIKKLPHDETKIGLCYQLNDDQDVVPLIKKW